MGILVLWITGGFSAWPIVSEHWDLPNISEMHEFYYMMFLLLSLLPLSFCSSYFILFSITICIGKFSLLEERVY